MSNFLIESFYMYTYVHIKTSFGIGNLWACFEEIPPAGVFHLEPMIIATCLGESCTHNLFETHNFLTKNVLVGLFKILSYKDLCGTGKTVKTSKFRK